MGFEGEPLPGVDVAVGLGVFVGLGLLVGGFGGGADVSVAVAVAWDCNVSTARVNASSTLMPEAGVGV